MSKSAHWPLTVGTGITSVFNLVLPLVVVRSLPLEEVGRYKIFFLYMLLVPLLVGSASIQHGVGFWAGDEVGGHRKLRAAWSAQLLAGLLVLIAILALHRPLAHLVHWPEREVLAFAFAALLAVVSRFYEELCIAEGRVLRGSLFLSGFELLRTAAILVAALTVHDLVAIYWAHIGATGLKTVAATWLGAREGRVATRIDRADLLAVGGYALPVHGSLVLYTLVQYSDQMMLSGFLSPAEFALYSIGCLDLRPLQVLEQSVARVTVPRIARAMSDGDREGAQRLHREAVEELSWVLIPAAVALAVFARPILSLLYGTRFTVAAGYLVVYAATYALLILPYDLVPRALGRGKWLLRASLAAAGCAVVLTPSMTFLFGAYGALGALVLSQIVMKGLGLAFLKRELAWRWEELFPTREVGLVTAASAAGAALALSTRGFFPDERTWMFGCGGLLGLAFLASGAKRYIPIRSVA